MTSLYFTIPYLFLFQALLKTLKLLRLYSLLSVPIFRDAAQRAGLEAMLRSIHSQVSGEVVCIHRNAENEMEEMMETEMGEYMMESYGTNNKI